MPTRRQFLRNSAILAGGVLLTPDELWAARAEQSLMILHTNDFHSRLDSFPDNHPKYAGQGGIARLKTLMDEARSKNEHCLLLDCGDVFQGTPYFNRFGGVPEYKWMNMAGYEATTLGNHDFDMGMEHLAGLIRNHARFGFVNCNYGLENTPLNTLIQPRHLVKKGRLKIGITGVGVNPEGLIPADLCRGVVYKDPVKSVQEQVDFLRNKEKCDVVVVLSHLGFEYPGNQISDRKLAAETHGIDVILGGHTHTFLEAPLNAVNKKNSPVIVSQAGWAGLQLGHIKLSFK
jgi:5'-nucleotidase